MTKKKTILFPVINKTQYYSEEYWEESKRGQPSIFKGTLLDYVYYDKDIFDWEENKVFNDTLTYIDYGRGRSSVTFYFKGIDDAQYPMFLTDMSSLLLNKDIIDGKVTGTWTFVKRGKNYGIKLVDDELKS
jgi:hypothetical protein